MSYWRNFIIGISAENERKQVTLVSSSSVCHCTDWVLAHYFVCMICASEARKNNYTYPHAINYDKCLMPWMRRCVWQRWISLCTIRLPFDRLLQYTYIHCSWLHGPNTSRSATQQIWCIRSCSCICICVRHEQSLPHYNNRIIKRRERGNRYSYNVQKSNRKQAYMANINAHTYIRVHLNRFCWSSWM